MSFDSLPIPAQTGLAALVLWAIFERLVHAFGLHQRNARDREWLSLFWLQLSYFGAVLFGLADVFLLRWTVLPAGLSTWQYAGLPLVALGVVLRMASRITLRKQFSGYVQTCPEHKLVTRGVYHWVRHPAYLAFLCLIVGFPVCFGSLAGTAIAVFSGIPALVYRIRIEEAALGKWFGEEYRQYRRRTKALIPFLW
jgi:protein-S-isoprenylcysteine O-methyltransferase Ste14